MGLYPFVCAYRRYLKNARARLGEGTIDERERKLHFISKVVLSLSEQGKMSISNPSKFTEDDIIELFLALKNRSVNGKLPKRSTLRKQMQLLKDVCLDCKNRKVEDMLRDGRIRIGSDNTEPFSLYREDLVAVLQACKQVGGWKGEACCFATAMLTFLRLRPGELQQASLRDLDTRKWTFLVANPKGKGIYGEVKRLPIPDVLKPFVLDFLKARNEMLASKGIKSAEPLIPAVSCHDVNNYAQQAFGRLKKQVMLEASIPFKWKDFRLTGGQLALDEGVPIEQVSQSMRHASTKTTERYYCRARADPAFANVNETYNRMFLDEPAINAKSV
jgi:integrase